MGVRLPSGALFWGDISTGRILPSHGRDRGSSPRRSTRTSRISWVTLPVEQAPTSATLFVRRSRRRGGWPLGSPGVIRGGGRPVPGTVAHLGERLTGSQEVVGSSPTGSTTFGCRGPDSGAPVWYTGDGGCESRGQLRRGHRPTVKMAGSHPVDAGSTPAARSLRCGGSSTVRARGCQARDGGSTPPHRSVLIFQHPGELHCVVRAAP